MKQKLLWLVEETVNTKIDQNGKKTSTGEAQAKAVFNSLKEWGILDRIRGGF